MRDKLIELIQSAVGGCARHWAELIADHLIANGVTFADDNNDCGCTTCGNHGKADICSECAFDSKWEAKPMTNGDRIRAMSDEELAEFNNFCPFIDEECTMKGCNACILEWLKQPCEVEA